MMRLHLATAEARLPMDGALVKQGFLKLEKYIDLLKKQAREASAGESPQSL